jgi:hypothetical protein
MFRLSISLIVLVFVTIFWALPAAAQIGSRWTATPGYVWYVDAANLDSDPQDELIYKVGGSPGIRQIVIFDALTGASEWQSPTYYEIDGEYALAKVSADRFFFAFSTTPSNGGATTVRVVGTTDGLSSNGGPPVPGRIGMLQNYPNPFNPTTTIPYDVVSADRTTIIIFNALGQKVRTLVDAYISPGSYSAQWDGTDEQETPQASGAYIAEIRVGRSSVAKTMILLR